MKRKLVYPLLIIIVTILFYYFEDNVDDSNNERVVTEDVETNFFYLPTSTTGSIVVHDTYSLSYSEKHEQPEWVAYELKKQHLSRNDYKRPYFEIDKKVSTRSADWRNYKNSGYDRGHLCPAGDRKYAYKAFEETFLTSNVSPQNHEFNAGIWNELEQKTRYWANRYNSLYVVTGGILTDDLKTIGYEAVSVPDYFYKIILHHTDQESKMIAFMIPNQGTRNSLKSFMVSVDKLEELTGIDFFSKLADPLENRLESSSNVRGWKF